jgi:UDP-N-acetylmuramoyl-L-alanyl-D-glutamate--2,6-diaminopimelate ligase
MTRVLNEVEPAEIRGDPGGVDIRSVELDSRRVLPGALFCCVPGHRTDGHAFAGEAVERGAVAVLCEHLVDVDVPQARVEQGGVRRAMAAAAAALHGHPARRLQLVGITGTDGKTTVAAMVAAILDAAGRPAGVIGTLQGERTTPEAPVVQERLAHFVEEGREAAVMEVSSHALAEGRVEGLRFDVAAFTNLSHDHLDYHGTMEAYFEAKASLFGADRARCAVIDVDDPWGRRLAHRLAAQATTELPVVPVSMDEIDGLELRIDGSRFSWRGRPVRLRQPGRFNVANALVAAAVASCLGVDDRDVVAGLASCPVVPGRMEIVESGPPLTAIVDFAHTPRGLEQLLDAVAELRHGGRVLCVFGAGGDRDREKRPVMGGVAARSADVVVVTTDNPRHEDPREIIGEILAGIPDGCDVVVEPDRRRAIALAVDRAEPGDVVIVAGKGAETAQAVGDALLPFDDRVEVATALARRGALTTAAGRAGPDGPVGAP